MGKGHAFVALSDFGFVRDSRGRSGRACAGWSGDRPALRAQSPGGRAHHRGIRHQRPGTGCLDQGGVVGCGRYRGGQRGGLESVQRRRDPGTRRAGPALVGAIPAGALRCAVDARSILAFAVLLGAGGGLERWEAGLLFAGIFNVLCIAGAAGLAAPIEAKGIRTADVGWMLILSVLLLPLMRTGFKLERWEGAVLLLSYVLYLVLLWPE